MKAKGQFRPVFFSYFQFQDLCKSSSGGTDNYMSNSAVPTLDQFYLATSHRSKSLQIPLEIADTMLKAITLAFFQINDAKFGTTSGFVQLLDY